MLVLFYGAGISSIYITGSSNTSHADKRFVRVFLSPTETINLLKILKTMKRFTYSAMVALLTLGVLTTSTDAFAQSKKERKAIEKLEHEEARKKLVEKWEPSPIMIAFDSEPQGAKVVVDGRVVGLTPVTVRFPITYQGASDGLVVLTPKNISKLQKQLAENNKFSVRFLKDGYASAEEEVIPEVSYVVEPRVAQGFRFTWPSGVFHVFEKDYYASAAPASNDAPTAYYGNDTSIPQGEAYQVVNRDTPGRTALEQTIIRWMIDSEPRGARVFWRVVSNCPAQVKNTNESYFGTTPSEDTRSFAIQGLTYENSRDVQIEIKITRAGYIDQVTRFNVRQAIDQMEISTFFDLVKREE